MEHSACAAAFSETAVADENVERGVWSRAFRVPIGNPTSRLRDRTRTPTLLRSTANPEFSDYTQLRNG
jgi:hypothetical protein